MLIFNMLSFEGEMGNFPESGEGRHLAADLTTRTAK